MSARVCILIWIVAGALAACGDTVSQRAATGGLGGAAVGTVLGGPVVGTAAGATVGAATAK
jgi:osmotically inducible lipoprotein OsmB